MHNAVWIDGAVVDADIAHLPADDHGVLVGDGAFETLMVVGGDEPTAFAVARHLRRLRRSCAILGIDIPHTDDEMRAAIAAVIAAAEDPVLVRMTVTSGRGPLGSARGSEPGRLVVVAGEGGREPYGPGTAVAVFPHPRNEHGAMAGVKTTSYAENVVALRHAQQRGASEAIFANTAGHVCEGTGSNLFWTDGECIHTPPLSAGCLAGITRELLMEHVDVVETELPIGELPSVPEAFLTSSTRVVQSIATIDATVLPVVDGPLTKRATAALEHLLATDVDP